MALLAVRRVRMTWTSPSRQPLQGTATYCWAAPAMLRLASMAGQMQVRCACERNASIVLPMRLPPWWCIVPQHLGGKMVTWLPAGIVQAILARSSEFLPGLDVKAALAAATPRVGLRPHGKGDLPFVGPVPGVDNLLLNAGHSGSGLMLAPVSAQVIAHLLGNDIVLEHKMRDAECDAALNAAMLRPPRPPPPANGS